jgi:hypothetical protein
MEIEVGDLDDDYKALENNLRDDLTDGPSDNIVN